MNKQEAIESIKKISDDLLEVKFVSLESVIDIVSQINEPQKVVVPKFVAEWIEEHKGDYNKWDEEAKADFVFRSINDLFRFGDGLNPWDFTIDEKFSEWTNKSAYEFIIAILFGYEVEQEPLYTVEIPNPVLTDNSDSVTVLMKLDSGVVLTDVVNYIGRKQELVYQFTESEIKQDFDFLWQFAKEVE